MPVQVARLGLQRVFAPVQCMLPPPMLSTLQASHGFASAASSPLKAVRLTRSAERLLNQHRQRRRQAEETDAFNSPGAVTARKKASSSRTRRLKAATSATELLALYSQDADQMDVFNTAAALRSTARLLKSSRYAARKAILRSPTFATLLRGTRAALRQAHAASDPAPLPPHVTCMLLHSLLTLGVVQQGELAQGVALLDQEHWQALPAVKVPNLTQTTGLFTAVVPWLDRAEAMEAKAVRQHLRTFLQLTLKATDTASAAGSHACGTLWAACKLGVAGANEAWSLAALALADTAALTPGAVVMALNAAVALREGGMDEAVGDCTAPAHLPPWAVVGASSPAHEPLSQHLAKCFAHAAAAHMGSMSISEASGALWALLRLQVTHESHLPAPGTDSRQGSVVMEALAGHLLRCIGDAPELPTPGQLQDRPGGVSALEQDCIHAAWAVAALLHQMRALQPPSSQPEHALLAPTRSMLAAVRGVAEAASMDGQAAGGSASHRAARLATRARQVLQFARQAGVQEGFGAGLDGSAGAEQQARHEALPAFAAALGARA